MSLHLRSYLKKIVCSILCLRWLFMCSEAVSMRNLWLIAHLINLYSCLQWVLPLGPGQDPTMHLAVQLILLTILVLHPVMSEVSTITIIAYWLYAGLLALAMTVNWTSSSMYCGLRRVCFPSRRSTADVKLAKTTKLTGSSQFMVLQTEFFVYEDYNKTHYSMMKQKYSVQCSEVFSHVCKFSS